MTHRALSRCCPRILDRTAPRLLTTSSLLPAGRQPPTKYFFTTSVFQASTTPQEASKMETIKNTIAENFGGPAEKLSSNPFTLADVPDLHGKTAVVTGGNEGIGYGITHTLLRHNISKLVVVARSAAVFEGAREALAAEMGQSVAERVDFVSWDMRDLRAAKGVADQILGLVEKVDVLVCNAAKGIMTAARTEDGLDEHFVQNHVAHVLLTSHLLPVLKHTASTSPSSKVRIVTLSSNAHASAPEETQFASIDEVNKDVGPMAQYGRAKLANLIYARYLAEHLTPAHPNLLANAVHPGFVSTKQSTQDIHEPYPLLGYGVSTLLEPFKKSQFEGAQSALYAATVFEGTGEYICPPARIEESSGLAVDLKIRRNLMDLTRTVIEKVGVEVPDFY